MSPPVDPSGPLGVPQWTRSECPSPPPIPAPIPIPTASAKERPSAPNIVTADREIRSNFGSSVQILVVEFSFCFSLQMDCSLYSWPWPCSQDPKTQPKLQDAKLPKLQEPKSQELEVPLGRWRYRNSEMMEAELPDVRLPNLYSQQQSPWAWW